MDSGQVVFTFCRLVLGALASFLAIVLWSRSRDTAWIFVIIGTIIAYVETVYSTLSFVSIGSGNILSEFLLSVISLSLSCLPTVCFIAAFAVMITRKYHH